MRAHYLACGIAGPALAADERALLAELEPAGIVLFTRNVASRAQVADLAAELAALPWRPYVAVDLEGGRVDRLSALTGPLPAPAQAAAGGPAALAALGSALGATCAHFRLGVDFAPVLDVARAGGFVGQEERCLGTTPAAVAAAAGTLLDGLERFGVCACLKHYPGLGSGAVDSHRELPVLGEEAREDAGPFHALAAPGRGVMIAHALAPALGEGRLPASLSATIASAAAALPGGPLIADDLEMGALARFGTIPERAAAALLAGCDQVLICNALGERAGVVTHLERWSRRDARLRSRLERPRPAIVGFGRGRLTEVAWDEVEATREAAWLAAGGRR